MAIDEKHLGDLSPEESAVERLRKRNKRIRPWEGSRIGSISDISSPMASDVQPPSGSKTQVITNPQVLVPSGQRNQGAEHPVGMLLDRVPEKVINPRVGESSGSSTPRVKHPMGEFPPGENAAGVIRPQGNLPSELSEKSEMPPGQYTDGVKYPEGHFPGDRQKRRVDQKNWSRRNNQRSEYPRGISSRGVLVRGGDKTEPRWSIDQGGGFDPRSFLPEQQQSLEWREKGYGELRIPHRLYEFLNKVTSTRNELLVLNCLVRFSLGFHREWCEAGYSFIASWTGISDITNVRKSVRSLMAAGVIRKAREHNSVSNQGSIYEVPVVQAYLSYLKASKAGMEQTTENNATAPVSDLPSGLNARGVESMGACRQYAHEPVGEMPTKKENRNQNSKKTLSSQLPYELENYLATIKAPKKRESEGYFLNKLLEEYEPRDISIAVNYVLEKGTLGARETCHSPMKYLATAIGEVLPKAKEQVIVTEQIFDPSSNTQCIPLSGATDANEGTDQRLALSAFAAELTEVERQKQVSKVTDELNSTGFLPTPGVLRTLAALRWFRERSVNK